MTKGKKTRGGAAKMALLEFEVMINVNAVTGIETNIQRICRPSGIAFACSGSMCGEIYRGYF